MLRAAAAGLALGVCFGAVSRVWMRLVADEPEFSWDGTTAILISAGAAGLGAGLMHGARESGRRRWWRLSALLGLPFVAAPQALGSFLIAYLLGGWGFSRRGPLALRRVALLLLVPIAIVTWIGFEALDHDHEYPGTVFMTGLLLLMFPLGYAGAELLRAWPTRRDQETAVGEQTATGQGGPR
jgi:hypothetical protein